MNKKLLTVSVGIPAYNEEANISNLLESLVNQKGKNFNLTEIIVVSDKSTDNTDLLVRRFKNKKIKLLVNSKRLGQSPSQEKIIRLFSGEILVLINADVLPQSTSFLEKLIEPFRKNEEVGLVSPKVISLKPNNLFESIINFSVSCKEDMLDHWINGNNVLHCHGMARAFSRKFAKTVKWPSSIGEDAYTYFLCLKNNYKFQYNPGAAIYYRSPTNFEDHKNQSARFIKSQDLMSKLFDKDFVTRSYQIPFFLKIFVSLKYFLKNPFLFVSYIFILLTINTFPDKDKYKKQLWKVSKSSKILKINAK